MNLRKTSIVGSLVFLLAGTAWARPRAASASQAAATTPTRIAVINIQNAIASTAEGRQAAQELQTRFTPRQTQIQDLGKQLQDLQTRIQNGQNTLSEAEKERLGRRYEELSREVQRKQQQLQQDAQDAREDVVDRIGQKMMHVIDNYAAKSGYSVVLDTSTQSTPVIYASNAVDITQTIVKLYDQTYPVKAAAAAPKPKP
jgi:outer membrane protein